MNPIYKRNSPRGGSLLSGAMKLKQVRKFKDLVSVLRQNGKYDTAIPRRIGIVKDANQKQSKKETEKIETKKRVLAYFI